MFVTRRPLWQYLRELWSWLFAAKVIAWLHLLGGLFGIITVVRNFTLIGGSFGLLLFAFSVAAGLLVLLRHREGVEAALAVESFQLVALWGQSFSYQFASGLQLYLYSVVGERGLTLSLQSTFIFGAKAQVSGMAIDLFSLIAIPTLWKAMRERDERERAVKSLAAAV